MVHSQLAAAIEIGKAGNVDARTFLYPALRARNFEELLEMANSLVPKDIQANPELLKTIFILSEENGGASRNAILGLVKLKDVQLSLDTATQFIQANFEHETAAGTLFLSSHGVKFLRDISSTLIPDTGFVTDALQRKLSLPSGTITILRALYDKNTIFRDTVLNKLTVTDSPTAFLEGFFSVTSLEDPAMYTAWEEVIHSSDEMQEALADNVDKILAKAEQTHKSRLSPFLPEQKRIQMSEQFQENLLRLRQLAMKAS